MASDVAGLTSRIVPFLLTAVGCTPFDAGDPVATAAQGSSGSTGVEPATTTAPTGSSDPEASSSDTDEPTTTGPLPSTSSSGSSDGVSVTNDTSDPTDPRCPGDGTDTPYCWPCGGGGWCGEGEVCVAGCEPAPPAVLCEDADLLSTSLTWPGDQSVGVRALAFGEVDGDALADLFIVTDDSLSLVLGAGGTSSIAITADLPNVIVVGDFDGSGTTDAVVLPGEDFDTLDVVTTDASGALTLAGSETSHWIWGAVAGDFDGSGTLDLLATTSSADDTWIRFGNGDGTFAEPAAHGLDAAFLAAADFDGDGMTDVASSRLQLWHGNATLDFGDDALLHGTFHQGPLMNEYYRGIVAAQFDGDGIPDLAALGQTFPSTTDYSLAWRGVPTGEPEIIGTPSHGGRLLALDADGDGRDDLVEIGETAEITLALGRTDVGNSLFSCWTTTATPFGVPEQGAFMAFGAAAAGDIDGDGDDELALSDGDQVVLLATP